MKNSKFAQALTRGLLAGYGGQTEFKTINRGSFDLKSSHFEQDGTIYHDEWTSGGGQEIVSVDGQQFTRVYAGGSVGNVADIISKLIYFIQELRDNTRLFTDCESVSDDWSYQYKVIDVIPSLDITVGKETITRQGTLVFVHIFILSPVT